MSISINVVIDDKAPSMTLTIDDGSGEVKSVVIPVQLENKKKKTKKPAQEQNEYPGSDTTITRPTMDPIFTRFIATGDIAEIRDLPDHKAIFKNYIFCTLTDIKGRTIHIEKAATRGRVSMGLMPAQFWDDDLIDGLTEAVKEAPQRAVILTDGGRPFVITDIVFVNDKEWETMGRLFNSLYSKF